MINSSLAIGVMTGSDRCYAIWPIETQLTHDYNSNGKYGSELVELTIIKNSSA